MTIERAQQALLRSGLKCCALPYGAGDSARLATVFALVWLAPIAAVEYLEAAFAFASNHGHGMAIAQLDLANRPAGCIDLPENYRRSAHGLSRCSAQRRVPHRPI